MSWYAGTSGITRDGRNEDKAARPTPRRSQVLTQPWRPLSSRSWWPTRKPPAFVRNSADILEFAALQVGADGVIQSEFSMLVNVGRPLPPEIVRLTGITDEDVAEGRPIAEAMDAFLAFVGPQPVFFHNAPFNQGFLKRTGAALRGSFPTQFTTRCP